jgi:hypothetical protein
LQIIQEQSHLTDQGAIASVMLKLALFNNMGKYRSPENKKRFGQRVINKCLKKFLFTL